MASSNGCMAKLTSPKNCMMNSISSIVIATVVVIYAFTEQARFKPFYTPLKCTHPVANADGTQLTNTCENANQFDTLTKKEDSMTYTYMPTSASGDDLLEIGHGVLTHDVSMKAESTTEITLSLILNMTAMQSPEFFGIVGSIMVHGYAPTYTKTVATAETCMKLFMLPTCNKATSESWCGWLSGPCLLPGTNVTIPTCAYTRSVCSSTKEEMLRWATPEHLGLTVVAQYPCPAATGLPATFNCSLVSAPGIDATMQMQPILDYVEQKATKKDLEELQKGENMIVMMTSMAIAFNLVQIICCFGVGAHSYRRWRKPSGAESQVSEVMPGYPTVLTSEKSHGDGKIGVKHAGCA
jgi:hypothetical protein